MNREVCREIIESLMKIPKPTKEDVNIAKVKVAGKQGLACVTPNSELIQCLNPHEKRKLLSVLKRKATRTISGVTIIAAMTKPWPCPHDAPCAYCPGGPSQGVPQSYTGYEPAAMRGIQNQYDPYMQVRSRIKQLKAIGHVVDKVELIVMGGTFPNTPTDYQEGFVKGCLDALIGTETESLEETKRLAETSKIRNVGITVETRPDWAKRKQIDHMLSMGVTRVEVGVQNVYDDIYRHVKRGHTVKDVVEATRMLKDAGLKVLYHLMPGLPGSGFERDLEGFKTVFADSDFKPDMIKIYPCLVLKGTRAYEWWRNGKYTPYSTEEAVRLIAEVKKLVPPWVRIMRIQRDIPAYLVEAGVKKSNLRQLVLKRLEQEGVRCRCIRCREVGHRWLRDKVKPDPENVQILSVREKASEGVNVFISAEDPVNDVLIGYLRLRIPSENPHRPEILSEPSSIVRELHVYGYLVPIGKRIARAWQHKGYGAVLLSEAERISKEEYGRRKVVVISALGTKRYYMRFGYKYDGPYMSKMLKRQKS
ncbi:MAG: tRNA uridine(34) 5-carboxymethylaminomethyl modification radical SAM/GNAT enzyme Elp3 [Candidatus Bathyarchaeota archaeon]|nr:tRNA uridine(34) 5-carboxymethylaminomethyl modification radical SAM/GNAT enzyme Elp3 [Candidatus Bathyarchaeota archaeon]MDH5495468.1 tRNA uridine(34) 5-carboxymethylaminomethyl modification radical SAM/GNAT enzyme Elp3 [Candidatus Bathyarchaeota archaeon]